MHTSELSFTNLPAEYNLDETCFSILPNFLTFFPGLNLILVWENLMSYSYGSSKKKGWPEDNVIRLLFTSD